MNTSRVTWLQRIFSFVSRFSVLVALGGLTSTTSSAAMSSTDLKTDPIDRITEIREALLTQDSMSNNETAQTRFDKLAQWPNWNSWSNSWNNYWRNF